MSLARVKVRKPKAGYVYLMQRGSSYKIGKSVNPERRLLDLKTGSPEPIYLLHKIATDDMVMLESYLHDLFWEDRIKDGGGSEFFTLAEPDVQWIKSLSRKDWHSKSGVRISLYECSR